MQCAHVVNIVNSGQLCQLINTQQAKSMQQGKEHESSGTSKCRDDAHSCDSSKQQQARQPLFASAQCLHATWWRRVHLRLLGMLVLLMHRQQ
jgi:hypothetical protein